MNDFDPAKFRNECVLTKTRRAARSVSRHFGKLLEPHDITASQASMLFVIYRSETASVSELADIVGIERSGLTRNLGLLEREGYVECEIGGRGGAKVYRLSETGDAKFHSLVPLWHQAQDELHHEMGDKKWNEMQGALNILSKL